LDVTTTREDGYTILRIEGAIVLGESGRELAAMLDRELTEGTDHVLLELSGINYMDSTGVGELVGHLTLFQKAGRRLVLVNPSKRICKLLELAGIDHVFETYATVEEAKARG